MPFNKPMLVLAAGGRSCRRTQAAGGRKTRDAGDPPAAQLRTLS